MRKELAFAFVLLGLLMLTAQSRESEEWLCNETEKADTSWVSDKVKMEPIIPTQTPITVALYVHEGKIDGPTLSDVNVVSQDGKGAGFAGITKNGYIVIQGLPGEWELTISRSDYKTESISRTISTSSRVDIYFSEKFKNSEDYTTSPTQLGRLGNYQSNDRGSEVDSQFGYSSSSSHYQDERTESPYAVDFDLRNMKGFNDEIISAEDINAFIYDKAPTSPMLNEADIGKCFMDAGKDNRVNPAFLCAIAHSEGEFGTKGWALRYPESHNTFGYGVDTEECTPSAINSAKNWCAMINRIATVIAEGDSYYEQGIYSVAQVYERYSENPDLNGVVNLMNELYSFSLSRKDKYNSEEEVQLIPQQESKPLENKPVTLSGYRPTFIPKQSGHAPTYAPNVAYAAPEAVKLGSS